ncbi:MAG: SPOR domain-containing protein, partial [Bacteroidetes bacterium]|nr:SPOR domain-containing protein [Bacteroidota bacterium]
AQKDGTGEFERVDQEESIIPETDEPVDIEVVEDDIEHVSEQSVPVRLPEEQKEEIETPAESAPTPAVSPRAGTMMWSVQLGAFKNESGAFELVEELKKKFNHPVYKRYDPATGYYKVTMGSFQDRDQAANFKMEVQSRGYPDAFTVEVAR